MSKPLCIAEYLDTGKVIFTFKQTGDSTNLNVYQYISPVQTRRLRRTGPQAPGNYPCIQTRPRRRGRKKNESNLHIFNYHRRWIIHIDMIDRGLEDS